MKQYLDTIDPEKQLLISTEDDMPLPYKSHRINLSQTMSLASLFVRTIRKYGFTAIYIWNILSCFYYSITLGVIVGTSIKSIPFYCLLRVSLFFYLIYITSIQATLISDKTKTSKLLLRNSMIMSIKYSAILATAIAIELFYFDRDPIHLNFQPSTISKTST